MNNKKILEILELPISPENIIDKLRKVVNNEIHRTSVIKSTNKEKRRSDAMNRFYKFNNTPYKHVYNNNKINEFMENPFEYDSKTYFYSPYVIVATKEKTDLVLLKDGQSAYENIKGVINKKFMNNKRLINFKKVYVDAKLLGYKNVIHEMKFDGWDTTLLKIDEVYFKFILIDQAFSIIDDGFYATIYIEGTDNHKMLKIVTTIGECYIPQFVVKDELPTKIIKR